jgi:L-2,4-diaminobutyrate decarboxylase
MPDSAAEIIALLEADMSRESAALFTDLAASYFADTRSGEGPVSSCRDHDELVARFDSALPRGQRSLGEIVEQLRDEVIPDSNRLWHPRYVGHQVSPPLPAAVWTEVLISALNQSVAVWEMSPVGTVVESRVIRWLCDLAGFGAEAGGTLTTGGTEATVSALLAARSAAIPEVWEGGVGANPPVIVCGEHAHYAITRAAGQLGLGMRSVVFVPSRDMKMDVDALREILAGLRSEGKGVMALVATAGTTATGAFDDLDAIATVCDRYGIWLHVDAAHGGSAVLSAQHRERVAGIERAQSIAWDPHKMMLLPLQAGVLLVRDERALEAAFSQRAPYLFHGTDGERVHDQGVRSFLCSRRADALKLWVALQRYGIDGFGALYEHLCATTTTFHAMIEDRDDFESLHRPESNILCFRWVGDGTRSDDALDVMNRRLRERFNRSGEGWITSTLLGGRRVLRVTIMNPRTTARDLDRVLNGLAKQAAAIDDPMRA